MPIDLKLFGDLRKKADPKISGTLPLRLKINDPEIMWVADILRKYMIKDNEVSHIFVNGIYAGLKKKVKSGDKVALFPRNMGLLYKWYFKREEDE
ncbi:MAG: MoaD/ThiS family protein [Promethearchaeota archaeon]|jgi:molybdopterin converting factor small subunit